MITAYENLNAMEAAEQTGLNIFVKMLKEADLYETLESANDITVFAPDDHAFNRLEKFLLDTILKVANREKLVDIFKYHIIPGIMTADAIESVDNIEMLNGQKVDIFKKDSVIMINDAEIIEADIKVKNGIIHKINRVLLPE